MPRTEIAILLLLFAGVSPAVGEDDDLTTRRGKSGKSGEIE